MPRPTRKPKRFNPAQLEGNTAEEAPVVSTPLHSNQSTTNPPPPPASPDLSPIQRESNFAIYDDTIPESDEFGFLKVKGIKKTIVPIQIDSDVDDEADDEIDAEDEVVSLKQEDDEDIYGEQIVVRTTNSEEGDIIQSPPVEPRTQPHAQKKPIRNLRTSQLLPLLPARRKRHGQKKVVASLDTSDNDDDDVDVKSKSHGKKRRVVDKENDVPEGRVEDIDSEEERAMEERRDIVKRKFAEVDQWEMAFETVDLSFSSQ